MTSLPLPTASYVTQDPRGSSKRLVNAFSEQVSGMPWVQLSMKDTNIPPRVLRRMAGTTGLGAPAGNANPVRGMWEMAGVEYVVVGSVLYSVTQAAGVATYTQVGTGITGTGFVRMTDNGACLTILVPGTTSAWTYSVGGGFQALTATFFTNYGAIDCWFCDTYTVFLALDGRTFFNDDGRNVSGNNQITFTTQACFTREFGTDPFVGGAVDHREVVLFGRRTTEGYLNTGNVAGSPFSSAPNTYMQIGCQEGAAYSVALQDQSVFWLANDGTIRRREGQTPQRVSNSGIEQLLATIIAANQVTGCYALAPTVGGHPLYILTFPLSGNTIAYDCLTQEWCELESYGFNTWRPLCYHNGLGLQLVGDSGTSGLGYLNVGAFQEWGTQQVVTIQTQSVYFEHNRIVHRRLELAITTGNTVVGSPVTGCTLNVSDDSGQTFWNQGDNPSLGANGATQTRLTWFNLGQSRDRVYQFQFTGNTPLFAVNVTTDIAPGKW